MRNQMRSPAAEPHEVKQAGTVKWFNPEMGFGFIVGSDAHDVLVRSGAVLASRDAQLTSGCLTQGQQVEFEIVEGKYNPEAVNIKVIG